MTDLTVSGIRSNRFSAFGNAACQSVRGFFGNNATVYVKLQIVTILGSLQRGCFDIGDDRLMADNDFEYA